MVSKMAKAAWAFLLAVALAMIPYVIAYAGPIEWP